MGVSSVDRVLCRSAHPLDGGSFSDGARTAERSRTPREEGCQLGDAYRVDDPQAYVAGLTGHCGNSGDNGRDSG